MIVHTFLDNISEDDPLVEQLPNLGNIIQYILVIICNY